MSSISVLSHPSGMVLQSLFLLTAFYLIGVSAVTWNNRCLQTSLGREYDGVKAMTNSGKTCQRWDSQYPHSHNQNAENMPDSSLTGAANYCRNPDLAAQGLWCYTTDPNTRADNCRVPQCNDYCHRGNKDCNGWDIRHIEVENVAECQQHCNMECRCKSIQAHGSTCWLKYYACSSGELREYSGNDYVKVGSSNECNNLPGSATCGGHSYHYCRRGNKDCAGRDIRCILVGNAAECKRHCSKDCRCKSIQTNRNECWLKHHACSSEELREYSGNDYVKVVAGENCNIYHR